VLVGIRTQGLLMSCKDDDHWTDTLLGWSRLFRDPSTTNGRASPVVFFFFFWKGLWKAQNEVPAGAKLLVEKYSSQLSAATQAQKTRICLELIQPTCPCRHIFGNCTNQIASIASMLFSSPPFFSPFK
jgi:hypothetical protein